MFVTFFSQFTGDFTTTEQKHPIAIHFGVGVRNFKGAGLEKRSHILLILLCDGLLDQELTNETAILKWGQGLTEQLLQPE